MVVYFSSYMEISGFYCVRPDSNDYNNYCFELENAILILFEFLSGTITVLRSIMLLITRSPLSVARASRSEPALLLNAYVHSYARMTSAAFMPHPSL